MANEPRKPRAIKLVDFREEVLPSGRKLLHCVFQERYSDWRYEWTPPWRDKEEKEHGVEQLFFKALEVEDYNDPKGVWDEELKKIAEEIPALKEFQLPVQVECSELTDATSENWAYSIEVSIISESTHVSYSHRDASFSIANCAMEYATFTKAFGDAMGTKWGLAISKSMAEVREGLGGPLGVSFRVWIPQNLARAQYRLVGREVAAFVRSYLRRVLRDYETLKKGFQD